MWLESFINYRYKLLAATIIVLYACCNFYCITRLSVTGDESVYYHYGADFLKLHPQKETINNVPVYNSQMPVVAINVLPRAMEQIAHPSLKHNMYQTLEDVKVSRIFCVICALFLAVYVLAWSTKLYGKTAGIFSLLLYALCPNIMAYSQMVGTDVYSFLICTAILYHTWQYCRTGNRKQLVLTALLLGLGQLSKQSLLLFYPLVFSFLMARCYHLKMPLRQSFIAMCRQLFVIVIISILIINAGFLFYKTGTPLNRYHFVSAKFIKLQKQLVFAANIPIPLPQPYVAGFDYVAFNIETPPGIDGVSSYGAAYFLGKPFTGKRIWYYYTICFLFKLPVPFLIFFSASLLFFFKYRKHFSFWQNESFLLVPAAFIFINFSLFNTMYLGIKNVLMLLPVLFIFCGSLINIFSLKDKKMGTWILIILAGWQVISVYNYFPHFLPYTNEFITNKKEAYKVFGDANLYFQEGRIMADEYLAKHPNILFEPSSPVHGKVMVSLETYFDYWHQNKMRWLTSMHLQPADHFHSQYLIFDIP